MPVAAEIAHALEAPLDMLLVRRLQVPWHEELVIGAVASTGERVLDKRAVRELDLSLDTIEQLTGEASRALERQARAYRGDRPPPDVANRIVILVEEALLSSSTMRAVRLQEPARVVVAVPVAPPDVCADLRGVADAVVSLREPERLGSPRDWYEDSADPEEAQIRALLATTKAPPASSLRNAAAARGGLRRPVQPHRRSRPRPDRRGQSRHTRVLRRARGADEAADRRLASSAE